MTTLFHPKTSGQVLAAGLTVLATITAIAYLAGLAPLFRAKSTRAELAQSVLTTESESNSLAGELRTAENKSAALAAQIKQAGVLLQPASAINTRLQEIVTMLAAHGLVIETQQQEAPRYGQEQFGTLAIRIKSRGTYQQCAALLHDLNQQYKDLGVDSFELSGNPAEAHRQLSFTLGLVWYVATPPGSH